MRTLAKSWMMGLALVASASAPGSARGQVGAGGATNGFANPYTSPYLNPYLNPTLTNGSLNRNDALMYLWTAQQQPGGVLAQNPATSRARRSTPRVAEMPRSVMKPGGGAAGFFNSGRTSSSDALAGRYQRTKRYFGNNGR